MEISQTQMTAVYRFLAQSMRYPDSAWFTDEYLFLLHEFLRDLEWFGDETCKQNFEILAAEANNMARLIEELQIDHTRLFINAIPKVVAPPYGSVYLTADSTLYGPSTELTAQYYRKKGFVLSNPADLPDHLVVELEFLALLSAEEDFEGEHEFLQEHFRIWFSLFRESVLNDSAHYFYVIIIKLIDFFTLEEEHGI